MNDLDNLIEQIERHSPEGLRKCFEAGINANILFNNEPLIFELTSEYTRSARFKECVQVFVEHGLEFDDPVLLSVLLNDATKLEALLAENPEFINKRYNMRCAYTPFFDVTLLHICAEFNHVDCARVLVEKGLNVNAKAGTDDVGFGGQTPIFHTVNQNSNQSKEMLDYLLSQKADLDITVKGLVWGQSYSWETFIPAVNPISYAMMGLLPQMHRDERTVNETVQLLMKHRFGTDYIPGNIPNKYLSS